jgi:hypothetical protein
MKINRTIEELESTLISSNTEVNELFKKITPMQNRVVRLRKSIDLINAEISRRKIESMVGVDWDFLLYSDWRGDSVRHNRLDIELSKYDLKSSGYIEETHQAAIQIAMIEGDQSNLDKTEEGLKIVLPHLKPLSDGYAHICILEYTLSRYGVYRLKIKDGEVGLNRTVYSRMSRLKTWKTTHEALEYIQKQHPYQKLHDEDDDTDD